MKKYRYAVLPLLVMLMFSCVNQPTEKETKVEGESSSNHQSSGSNQTLDSTNDVLPEIKNDTTNPIDFDKLLSDQRVNIKETVTVNTKTTTTVSGEKISINEMYRHYEKSPQIFTIPIDKDTIIECKEVTTLRIPANSFMIESSGEAVNGDVEISVKEYYDLSDMILANLSTMSGDKILETGGMIHISANSHGENCILKKDREIKIGFPYFSEKKDMQLFSGDWKNNNIDWTPMIPSDDTNKSTPQETDQPELEIFTVVEAMPSFPGGNKSFDAYMSQNLKYPFSALEDKSEGTVYVTFVVDEFGFITNPRVLRGVNRALDKAAVYVISKMPQWIPGTQRSIPVPVQFNMPVTFSLDKINLTEKAILEAKEFEEKIEDVSVVYNVNGFSTDDSVYQEEFERQVEEEGFQSTGVSQLNRYLFSTSQLGWINCDIFFRDNRPKINYIVETNNTEETFVKVIFHSVKSILYGLPSGNNYFFRKVPEGEKITIVAFRNANEQLLLAVKESVVSKNGEINLDFQPITLDLLKMEMEKINSIN